MGSFTNDEINDIKAYARKTLELVKRRDGAGKVSLRLDERDHVPFVDFKVQSSVLRSHKEDTLVILHVSLDLVLREVAGMSAEVRKLERGFRCSSLYYYVVGKLPSPGQQPRMSPQRPEDSKGPPMVHAGDHEEFKRVLLARYKSKERSVASVDDAEEMVLQNVTYLNPRNERVRLFGTKPRRVIRFSDCGLVEELDSLFGFVSKSAAGTGGARRP